MHYPPKILGFTLYTLIGSVSCTPAPSPQSASADLNTYLDELPKPHFNRTVLTTQTYVLGSFLANFSHPINRDPAPFLLNQTKKIQTAGATAYPKKKTKDGPLTPHRDWIATGSNPPNNPYVPNQQYVPPKKGEWDLGLYVRPVPGQNLTYGILGTAIEALLDSELSVGDDKFAPVYARLSFDFEVHDGQWGLVAQGVLTECEAGGWDCFERFGLSDDEWARFGV